MKKYLYVIFAMFVLFFGASVNLNAEEFVSNDDKIVVLFFWGDGCPHCETQKPFLEDWATKYPEIEIRSYETWYDTANAALFNEVADAYGFKATGVPVTFIGDKYWIGFSATTVPLMEEKIEDCIENGCLNKYLDADKIENDETSNGKTEDETLNFFGNEIKVSDMPLLLSTSLIAFMDGLNPCSLWVLAFLLGIVSLTKDRKKIIIIGLTYLGVAGLAYGAFILGMINVFAYVSHLRWIMFVVALIAFTFGIINVKDFFWYKKGISLSISDKYKPKLYQRVRNLMRPENSLKSLMIGTAIIALGITLVELPCTAGLPMLWSNLVASQNVDGGFFLILFAVYLLIYFTVELIIFLTVVFTLKMSRLEEKHGRFLKLVGGMIMIALAVILAFDLDILNKVGGTLVLFASIILGSIVIAKVYDKYVGFEKEKGDL